ncbi:MAG: hypothetical protein WCE61_07810 [Candidatus Acidiferrum sp.]
MTPQRVTTFDFKEITAVDLTCAHCGTLVRLVLPVEQLDVMKCAGCKRQIVDGQHNLAHPLAVALLKALSDWQRHQSKDFALGFSIVEAD